MAAHDPVPGKPPEFAWTSERTLRIELGAFMSQATSDRVCGVDAALRAAAIRDVVGIIPAYTTVAVTFDPTRLIRSDAEAAVRAALASGEASAAVASRVVEIPVCYEPAFGIDLEDVARHHGCEAEEVVRRHVDAAYRVSFLGFSPGFAYLSGLPESLATPRLARPRERVPAGSVAIGGGQTGVYPHSTPGGWRIIGRTPLVMFDPGRHRPAWLSIGDHVRFVPIDAKHFERLSREGTP